LNDILEASNLESDTVTLIEKPLKLNVMLDEISMGMKPICDDKKLEWATEFRFKSNHFMADGLRLRQALSHLLDNAVKFSPEGGKVTFAVEQKSSKNGKVLMVFTVRDTGVGIPIDKIATIFNPFEQAEEGKYTSGSGLGLSIVRKILELFDSRLDVHSKEGKGSEFSFEIWLRERKSANNVDFDSFKGRFTGQKALVVDDVRINRVVLVNFLKEAGFATDEAEDGKVGAEMFENSPENTYSVIFMDIQMPVMDGWESAIAIRHLPREDAKTVPIVTISANAFDLDVKKSMECGMDSHYAKPVQKEVLAEIFARFCKPSI
jgi:CheY-like chemotaxis protein